ncbi:CoA pyrophosphatase [Sphingomonas xanthus]|uniref:CoA pyrophosphatase n=1 Tax=Sphingomonas xanthus TaxID=2594473 RepID=A0A516ITH4_9SPHN|nr:CoA pyrophosphatase [Sphingomonas xanthus]QDP20211.1 CoA pyrophosphatase [Sphingomonas xanthus]
MTLVDSLRSALGAAAPAGLLAGDLVEGCDDPHRAAAVLVAITDRPDPGIILTVRRPDLRTHPGQIAFPGGRIDEGEDARAAALREAWEEIALEPAMVHLIGEADRYRTVTGFCVTPVVGLIPPDLPLHPHEAEVADWFEAPLDFVLDPVNQRRMTAEFRGATRHYYQIDWQGRPIWGATAAMLVNLAKRVAALS